MHFILLLSLNFLPNLDFCPSTIGINSSLNQLSVEAGFLLVHQKVSRKKIRWKQVFRPIRFFNKKLKFWLLVLGVISLGLGSFFLIADFSGGLDGLFFKFLFGIFATSTLLFILCLLVIPFILIARIVKEIKWSKRFSTC